MADEIVWNSILDTTGVEHTPETKSTDKDCKIS